MWHIIVIWMRISTHCVPPLLKNKTKLSNDLSSKQRISCFSSTQTVCLLQGSNSKIHTIFFPKHTNTKNQHHWLREPGNNTIAFSLVDDILYLPSQRHLCLQNCDIFMSYYYIIYQSNLPAVWNPNIPCSPTDNCVLPKASISALNVLLIFSLCSSINTLTVCLKWDSFIWHKDCQMDSSSWLNCFATAELTSRRSVGQMTRLLKLSSGCLGFIWWNWSYSEYLSDVLVIGCTAGVPFIFCCNFTGNGNLRFFTHCISTFSSFLVASFRLSVVGAQSLPSCGLKNIWLVWSLVWLATSPAMSEM